MTHTFRDLKNNVGNTLQLQILHSNKDERFYVKLIGVLENKSILITAPRADGGVLKTEERQEFIIRMMSGSSAHVFTSTAIFATNRPYAHLHLTYPESLESITVRKAERVNCKLIVSVQDSKGSAGEGVSASMHDISTAGAQLLSKESLGDVGDSISINTKFSVAGIDQHLLIPGIIRRAISATTDDAEYEYGIEFNSIKDKEKLILTAFVYEQMMQLS